MEPQFVVVKTCNVLAINRDASHVYYLLMAHVICNIVILLCIVIGY